MIDDADGSRDSPPHASSYPDDTGRPRRRSHHHSAGADQSRKERDSAHSGTSSRRLLRLLIEEEYQSSQLRKLLSTAFDRIEAETRRATDAERLAQDTSRLTEAKAAAQQDAARANQQLSLCTRQLDSANREIQAMRERLSVVEGQRDEAEAAASKARATARKLNEQRLVQIAREEGRRLGFEAGFVRGQRLGFEAARAYDDGHGELPQILSRPLIEGPPDPPQLAAITEDAASDRSASPTALPARSLRIESPVTVRRPPVILETDFDPRLTEFDSSLPTATTMADVGEGSRHQQSPPRRNREGIFQPQPLKIVTPSSYEPVPGPSRLSSSRTPPIQVFTVDIPPHHELEQEAPPPPTFTPSPPEPDTRPTHSGPPPPSNLSRSNTFGFLSRRVRRPSSNDTSSTGQFDAANRPRRHSLSAIPENAEIRSGPNADAHRASAMRQSQSSGAETNTSGHGLIPRRLSKMIKKLAGSMDRNSTDRHSNKEPQSRRSSYHRPDDVSISQQTPSPSDSSPSSRTTSNRGGPYRSVPSSPGSPPEITIVPPSRPSSDSTGRPDFMSSHLLSPDHTSRPLPPVIPDAHHHPSTTTTTTTNIPISISAAHPHPQPSSAENALPATGPPPQPDPWLLPQGFVPNGGFGHDPWDDDDEDGVVIPHRRKEF